MAKFETVIDCVKQLEKEGATPAQVLAMLLAAAAGRARNVNHLSESEWLSLCKRTWKRG